MAPTDSEARAICAPSCVSDTADIGKVRRAMAALESAVAEMPPENRTRVARYLNGELLVGKDDVRAMSVRLPADLIERIDAAAEQLNSAIPVRLSRNAMIEALLTRGVEAIERDGISALIEKKT